MARGWEEAREKERRGRRIFEAWMRGPCGWGFDHLTTEEDQYTVGDYIIKSPDGVAASVEFKCDVTNIGNVFFEMFSNQRRGKIGWCHRFAIARYQPGHQDALTSDWLAYYDYCRDNLLWIRVNTLVEWGFEREQLRKCGSRPRNPKFWVEQKTHDQPNDAWGWAISRGEVTNGLNLILPESCRLIHPQVDLGPDFEGVVDAQG